MGATDVFVAKVNAAGNLIWMKRAGGGGIDRGFKIAVRNGTVAVVGQFMGTANLFGTAVSLAPGAIDAFVASLDANTGNANWVATGGSPDHVDRPNGVEISPNGSVTMVGEFKGDAVFGGQTVTSMIDPNNSLPSLDVFIAHYSNSGAMLWLQQGAAKYMDKAIDVVSDAQNNLYVCGQFSDTVTFDVQHDNIMYNATFVIKLDGLGNEQWFRKCGGAAFNHVRDMLLTSTNQLLLCGDLQGTMVYADATPDMVDGIASHAYYLMRVALNGDFVSASVMPSENPVSARSIDQRADTVVVLGEFNCQFTGLSDFYNGSGLFMAVGDPDLFVARHRFSDLGMMDAQQFGGQQEKFAGGLCSLSDGSLIFGSAYEETIVLPWVTQYNPTPGTEWPWYWVNTDESCFSTNWNFNLGTYCSDPAYGIFGINWSQGYFDGMVSRGYVTGRRPYDMWVRQPGAQCSADRIDP
ncbi:MAG TPA: hypothetical protein PK760_12665, partial [Flavobacteriales bacterium]|nr:hypothetical protein [Flavobacteriales bacterium]